MNLAQHLRLLLAGSTNITTVAAGTQAAPVSKSFYLTSNATTGGPWAVNPGAGSGTSGSGNVGTWTSYTPSSYQGLRTPTSVNLYYRTEGTDSIRIMGRFTIGTATASEVRIALPAGYTVNTTFVTALQRFGDATTDLVTSDIYSILANSGNTYFGFGRANGSRCSARVENWIKPRNWIHLLQ